MNTGVWWYLGIPQIGKTELALKHLRADIAESGFPTLVIDSMRAKNFRREHHAETVDEVVETVWKHGRHCFFWPRNSNELDRVILGVVGGWRCHVLIDEAHIWMDGRYLPDSIGMLMRGHAHWNGTVRLTTQFYGDVSKAAKSVAPVLYIFACEDETTLERLVRETKYTEEQIKNLPDYEYLMFDPREARKRRLEAMNRPPPPPAPPGPAAQ